MWRFFYTALQQPHHRRSAAALTAVAGSTFFATNRTSILSCDPSKPSAPKKAPNVTFRKRRLSIVSPQDGADGDDNEGKVEDIPKPLLDDKSSKVLRCSYAIEIEGTSTLSDKKKLFAEFLSDLGIKGMTPSGKEDDLEKKHHTTYARKPVEERMHADKPFPDDKVGAFSAHGIEPHPYMVKEEPSFFSSHLEPQIVTLVTQKINQDRGIVAYPFGNCEQTALFGIFDGHGLRGELVAEYAMNEITRRLHRHSKFQSNLDKAFHQTFLKVDADIERKHEIEPYHSGTTACVAVLRDNLLSTSNVGDSRAVLGRRKQHKDTEYVLPGGPTIPSRNEYESIELTKDQNAKDPVERKRVLKAGGFVAQPTEPGLPTRIYLDRACTEVGLAMSRSIGDHNMKRAGVIADPVITHYTITDQDEFLIIATDGVWEFIDSSEAVKIVGACFDKGCTASEASIQLIRYAMKTWQKYEGDYRDDCTAIVVRLPGLWDKEDDK